MVKLIAILIPALLLGHTGPLQAMDYEGEFDTSFVQEELLALSRTCYGEARSESIKGKAAVVWTVINRKNSGVYPGTIKEVVMQPSQYSAWSRRDPNRKKMLAHDLESDNAQFRKCVFVSTFVLFGAIEDETGGSMDYHSIAVTPRWATSYSKVLIRGAHVFYVRN